MTPNRHREGLNPAVGRRSVRAVSRILLLLLVGLVLVLLAVGAWTVQAARWALTGSRRNRPAPATA
jgi:hypothetical protein